MQSWKTTQSEYFAGSQQIKCSYFKVDKIFVTYKRWNVWYEMKFDHHLN
jgi:hypothetical protein